MEVVTRCIASSAVHISVGFVESSLEGTCVCGLSCFLVCVVCIPLQHTCIHIHMCMFEYFMYGM